MYNPFLVLGMLHLVPWVWDKRAIRRRMTWGPGRRTSTPGSLDLLSLFRDEYLLGLVFTADSYDGGKWAKFWKEREKDRS